MSNYYTMKNKNKEKLRQLLYITELKLIVAFRNKASDRKLRTLENNMRYLQAIAK